MSGQTHARGRSTTTRTPHFTAPSSAHRRAASRPDIGDDRAIEVAPAAAAASAAAPVDRRSDDRKLRLLLQAVDVAAIFLAFTIVLSAVGYGRFDPMGVMLAPFAAAAIGAWAIRFEGLWNSRIIAMRWIELSRLTRAVGFLGAGVLVLDRVFKLYIHIEQAVVACIVSWVLLVVWRSAYRSWLAHNRRKGRFTRRMIIIGTERRATELTRLFAVHPEAGMEVCGLIGSRGEADAAGYGDLWLGDYQDADDVLASTATESVVVCSADVSPALLNTLMRDEQGRGRELYFHPGLSGIDARRVKASPVAHEPLLYVESGALSKTDLGLKRVFDVVVAATLLVVTSPIFLAVAVAIRRNDRGPVLFRQQRVGQSDSEFGMLKFRTMVVDAEARLDEVQGDNQRSGPLFKIGVDPRVTRIGQFLRRTSLDELPQLINVLKGEMSLVGPRPALRAEVDEFPIELRERHRVRPGITGLWQVEARDNPAFDAYQRLDLFYVENWSLALDVVIMLGTAEQLFLRPFLSRKSGEMAAAAAAPVSATAA